MKILSEPTQEDLLRAEQYWEVQKMRVKKLAEELGYDFEPSWEYLRDLFDNGEAELTDEQVLEELAEDLKE